MRVADIIKEPLNIHAIGSAQDRATRAAELLIRCGLPADAGTRYPHQLSGGQRQRVAIARALALRPDVVICDEPTSALDVSVQAQILNLLQELQREFSLSYILISHDLAVVAHLCRRIAVMREGKIVELADREDLLAQPRHPYTAELLRAVPSRDFASL
jgi:ABC-type glutathione transport system ATPase component